MNSVAENLPSDELLDVVSLEEIINQNKNLIAQNWELTIKLEATQRQLTKLQNQIEQLLKRLYGRKSEKIDPDQLMLDSISIESLESHKSSAMPEPVIAQPVSKPRSNTKSHPGRTPIPDHLERVEILLDVPEEKKICPETGNPLQVISVEVSEKLEYRPGKLVVNVYKRPQASKP